MTARTQCLTKLSDAQLAAVQDCLAAIDAAEGFMFTAVAKLGDAGPTFHNERAKLARSGEALKWERKAVADRLAELVGRGQSRKAQSL